MNNFGFMCIFKRIYMEVWMIYDYDLWFIWGSNLIYYLILSYLFLSDRELFMIYDLFGVLISRRVVDLGMGLLSNNYSSLDWCEKHLKAKIVIIGSIAAIGRYEGSSASSSKRHWRAGPV